MNVLLIGNGGREHAIACQLVTSPRLGQRLLSRPATAARRTMPKTTNVPIAATAVDALLEFAQQKAIDLAIVGPEAPLVAGVVDRFQAAEVAIFGPTQAAAQIEGSKAFSKFFMQRHGIPTGRAEIFDDFDDAVRYLRQSDAVPVVKASGLAAGKGVILPSSREAAAAAGSACMLIDRRFGSAGQTVLLEERLSDPEKSRYWPSATATMCASCRRRRTTNACGMATRGRIRAVWAPLPLRLLLSPKQLAEIEQTILLPTIRGMAEEGTPFVGVLYAGIMLTDQEPRVLEYNCRFGDPETQVLLPLLDSDLLAILRPAQPARLDQVDVRWQSQSRDCCDGRPGLS